MQLQTSGLHMLLLVLEHLLSGTSVQCSAYHDSP